MVISELDRMIEVDLLRRERDDLPAHRRIDADDAARGYRQSTEIEVPEIIGAEPLVSQLDALRRPRRGRGRRRARARLDPARPPRRRAGLRSSR